MKPGVTAFVLFKNGEAILERFMASVKPFVEDIVAVDTGATDGSRAIAQSYKARVFDLEFPGAFDAAYNFCIEKVETEWTLYLDSDEWLDHEAGPMLRAAISQEEVFGYELIRRDLDDKGNHTEMAMFRLWRTHPLMRLVGVIHSHFPEEVTNRAAAGRKVVRSDIRFLHDGFAGPPDEEKIRRNIELIERELELRPGQPYYETNLAIEYLNLNDSKGAPMARELVDRALESESEGPACADLSFLFSNTLREAEGSELRSARTDKLIELGWKWFGRLPYVIWGIALAEERRGNHAGAFKALQVLEVMSDTGDYAKHSSFNPEVLGEPMRLFLALAAIRAQRPDIALRNAKKVLERNPNQPLALNLAAQLGKLASS